MRVGSVVYATDQGLGILAKDFYDNGIITDVVVVKHSSRETHSDWFGNSPIVDIRDLGYAAKRMIAKMDVMFFLETAFDWTLLDFCKKNGVRTVICPMYECMSTRLPYVPDKFICPSKLDLEYYKNYNSVFVPVPVNVPWKLRTRADVFIHNAGHGGLKGRNGTQELVDAMQYVKAPTTLLLRSQKHLVDIPPASQSNIDVRVGSIPYNELWEHGDVFIFPEKFNGLSLPLQEAYASGMLVMASDRFPNNTYLPQEPLIPVASSKKSRVSPRCNEFAEAIIDPRAIAEKIDEFYEQDITEYSLKGKEWAEQNSWEVLKSVYLKELDF